MKGNKTSWTYKVSVIGLVITAITQTISVLHLDGLVIFFATTTILNYLEDNKKE